MAATFKCTKIQTNMNGGTTSSNCLLTVSYIDPTTVPPTPGVIAVDLPKVKSYDDAEVQSNIDTALTLATGNEMDWTL